MRQFYDSLTVVIGEFIPSIGTMSGAFTIFIDVVKSGVTAFSVLKNIIMLVADIGASSLTMMANAAIAAGKVIQGDLKGAWQSIKDGAGASMQLITDRAKTQSDEFKAIWSNNNSTAAELRAADLANHIATEDAKKQKAADDRAALIATRQAETSEDLEAQIVKDQMSNDAAYMALQTKIANEDDSQKRLALIKKKEAMDVAAAEKQKQASMTASQKFASFINSENVKGTQAALSQISTMQDAHSKGLVVIGKAAAMANIIISTAQGISAAMAIPFIGIPLAAAVAASGAVQLAKVGGVQLAEGGIVKATSGGVPATIGEGGRDEAVIPLDKAGQMGGNTITINSYGGMLGSDAEAREFAVVIDRELMKLRRNNESVSFDSSLA